MDLVKHLALWSLDREGGVEKALCCKRARARDVARFGRLYLNGGRSHGAQILPADGEGDFYAYGHNGQYLYVNPRARTVIVKFSETKRQDPVPLLRAIARAVKRPENIAELDPLGGQAYAFHLPTERKTP